VSKARIVLLPFLTLTVLGCSAEDETSAGKSLPMTTVSRQDVVVRISATGSIEPIREIEIKSKASGAVLRVPVEAGDVVSAGDLLVQVDTTDVAAELRQTLADLEYRRAEEHLARQERERADDLLSRGMVSPQERDRTELSWARARAAHVSAQTAAERARDRLRETVVRAPSAGTILETFVAGGQIIASATSQVGGGTTLMRMANLRRLYARVLIDEVDLGKVRSGLPVTARVEAYPERSFDGTILKVEPTWREERDVIYFPIVIEIDNAAGLLLPGMTCEAEIHVDRREDVLAVSNHVLVAPSFAPETGELLDIPADVVRQLLDSLGIETTDPTKAVVFVTDSANRFSARAVTMGAKNWEVTEIVDGLEDSTVVAIPPSAAIAKQFAQYLEMIREHAETPGRR